MTICDCHPIEESAAPAPDVQEQPQHHLSSSCRPSRPFMEFTYKGARAAVHGRAFGAGRLVEWRMRRACSRFEAWGAWPCSRFAARSANCLKVAQRRGGAGARRKNCFVWQFACANGCHKFISWIWWRLLHETDDDRLMKMQARYTGPLKAARPPLSTTPYELAPPSSHCRARPELDLSST